MGKNKVFVGKKRVQFAAGGVCEVSHLVKIISSLV